MEEWIIGVDAGGTATKTLVADMNGNIHGSAIAYGCACYQIGGVEQCRAVMWESLSRALQSAGVSPNQAVFASFGISGADSEEDHVLLSNLVEELRAVRNFEVVNDTFIALRSGTTRSYGVGVIAGTGANAAAISPQGERWAYNLFCDWGGGLSLGKEALRLVLRSVDGRSAPTSMVEPVLEFMGYTSMEDLLIDLWAGKLHLNEIPKLSPFVFEAAKGGDTPARELLVRMGEEMALYATNLIRKFQMVDLPVEVVITGGLFQGESPEFSQTFVEEIKRVAPQAEIVRPSLPPSAGAVLLAMERAGRSPTTQVYDNLHRSIIDKGFASAGESIESSEDDEGDFVFPLFF